MEIELNIMQQDLNIDDLSQSHFEDCLWKVKKALKLFDQIAGLKLFEVFDFDRLRDELWAYRREMRGVLVEREENLKQYASAFICEENARKSIVMLNGKIKRGAKAVESKRQELISAGIPVDKVRELVPDYDKTEDLAKIEALEDELKSWREFYLIGSLKYLPKSFSGNPSEQKYIDAYKSKYI